MPDLRNSPATVSSSNTPNRKPLLAPGMACHHNGSQKQHSKLIITVVLVAAITAMLMPHAAAEQLRPETIAAFNAYVEQRETQISKELNRGPFLGVDGLPKGEQEKDYELLKKGEVITEGMPAPQDVPHGIIHHWIGTVFIPGATLARTLAFLQDYDNQYKFYAPDVQRSKLLQRDGNDFKVFLRLKKTKIVTVILDTTYDVKYVPMSADRAASYSYSRRIAEVENAGKPNESEKPVGDDSGFMWRLNSYWRFLQRDGGIYLQLEAISLTRDIPAGLGWLVKPFVTSIPEESIEFTLSRTRVALVRPPQTKNQ
jgi:hypothetical protein